MGAIPVWCEDLGPNAGRSSVGSGEGQYFSSSTYNADVKNVRPPDFSRAARFFYPYSSFKRTGATKSSALCGRAEHGHETGGPALYFPPSRRMNDGTVNLRRVSGSPVLIIRIVPTVSTVAQMSRKKICGAGAHRRPDEAA